MDRYTTRAVKTFRGEVTYLMQGERTAAIFFSADHHEAAGLVAELLNETINATTPVARLHRCLPAQGVHAHLPGDDDVHVVAQHQRRHDDATTPRRIGVREVPSRAPTPHHRARYGQMRNLVGCLSAIKSKREYQ